MSHDEPSKTPPSGRSRLGRFVRWFGEQVIVGDGGVLTYLVGGAVGAMFTMLVRQFSATPLPTSARSWTELGGGIAVGLLVVAAGIYVGRLARSRSRSVGAAPVGESKVASGRGSAGALTPTPDSRRVGPGRPPLIVSQEVVAREVVVRETVVTETHYVYPSGTFPDGE